VRLTVHDLWSIGECQRVVCGEGNQKIGNFTLSFTDLSVPLSGLPITVIRNYDSRDKKIGDFGVGWTLEPPPGLVPQQPNARPGLEIESGFLPCQRSRKSSLTRPSSALGRRGLPLPPSTCEPGGHDRRVLRRCTLRICGRPVPGATLQILGSDQVFYENDYDEVVMPTRWNVFEPKQVRLTHGTAGSSIWSSRKGHPDPGF